MRLFINVLKRIKHKISLLNFQNMWRKNNKHNFTTVSRTFPINIVKVGKMSYGPLDVSTWGNQNEKLVIGNYVSIASNVKFLLGGNHRIDTFSTYPFKVKVLGESTEATTKGKIVVEDDVWIGMDAMILSGVTIGKGAVIAARSVVTKDIAPYSIVGGNPAKLIRYRFDEKRINELISVDFSDLNDEFIKENRNLIYEPYSELIYGELFKRNSK